MIRAILFILTNLAIMLVFGVILNITRIQSNNFQHLMLIALLFSVSGSIISLVLSKWIAMHSVNGKIIKKPYNEIEYWLVKTVYLQSEKIGINRPQIAIYNACDINAFTTGMQRNNALIAVSTGLLRNMNHNEIEAVLAHEINHIANGDMVTMILIQGIVNTFVIFISYVILQCISFFLLKNNYKNKNNRNNSIIYFIISIVLEMVFAIIASIITMWFSRYREFRADAGAVNLVGRKKMIAALQRLKISYTPEIRGYMTTFFINGCNKYFSKLFSSHPSLDERIKALQTAKYIK
ncbi:Protease HtpX [Candidatus Profftia lariciata]|uniref:protease HtpX n=1 Tax=Candidatus Profftia lariciata TaxID=1987921 RepID=UPI001D034899|nr:protease HtpX [Candidatus Profftia lariciata]UDG81501.1 Protease HtpX [Candidatus Profftia lariciata]